MALFGICFLQAVIFVYLQSAGARTIEYFIGTVDVMWDYAPSGINLMTGVKLDEDKYACRLIVRCPTNMKMICSGFNMFSCTYEISLVSHT